MTDGLLVAPFSSMTERGASFVVVFVIVMEGDGVGVSVACPVGVPDMAAGSGMDDPVTGIRESVAAIGDDPDWKYLAIRSR